MNDSNLSILLKDLQNLQLARDKMQSQNIDVIVMNDVIAAKEREI